MKKRITTSNQRGITHHLVPLLAFVLLFAIGGTYFLITSHAATVGPPTPITGPITSGITGKCLDDWNGLKTNFNKIDAYTCNGSAQQLWTAETNGAIKNRRGGCLDVYKTGKTDGTPVDYYRCNGTGGAQTWKITGNTLFNPASGKCLTEPNTVNTAGVQLTVSTCNGSVGQVWNVGNTRKLAIGVADPGLIKESSAVQQAQLKQMASIGITSVRVDVNQQWVQYGGPTSFDWSQIDPEVQNIRGAGLTPELIIEGAARWDAVGGATDGATQPSSASQFAAWASAVATRYKSMNCVFEIWNEPNNTIFWHPAPNPSAYTQDLIAAYKSIKAVDPSATVISAGLAPEATSGGNIAPVTFLQDMYADGAKGSFDAVGYHPYSYPALPNTYETWSGWSQMAQTNPSIRSVMTANGDSAKQIWITEVGWPSNVTQIADTLAHGAKDPGGNIDEATEFTQAIANAKATSWIGGLYIYSWQDKGTDPTNNENWFGLLDHAGAKKPAYSAVQRAIK